MNGPIRTPESGRHQQKGARVKARTISALIPSPYGVISTKNLVIRPIDASTTLIVQVDQHLTQMVYGARLVIDQATLPLLALPPLSALLPKEKESNRVVKANMVIGCGIAKTSPPTTILTKPLQPCTRNLLLLLLQAGGTIKN